MTANATVTTASSQTSLFPVMDPGVMTKARQVVEFGLSIEKVQGLAFSNPALLNQLHEAMTAGLHPSGVDAWLTKQELVGKLSASEYGWMKVLVFPATKVLKGDMGSTLISKMQECGGKITLDLEEELLVGPEALEFISELKEVNPDMDVEILLDERSIEEVERERESLGGVVNITLALTEVTLLKEVHKQFGRKFEVKDFFSGPVYLGTDGDLTLEPPSPDAAPIGKKSFVGKPMFVDPKGQFTPLPNGSKGPNQPVLIGRVSILGEIVTVETAVQTKTRGTRSSIKERFALAQKITSSAISTSRVNRASARAESEEDDMEATEEETVQNLNSTVA